MKTILTFAIFVLCTFTNVTLADNNYMFKHITVNDGLPYNQVNNIFCDSQGFIWFSTTSGLGRYDGYNMMTFPSDSPLANNHILQTQELADGKLLVTTGASQHFTYNPANNQVADFDEQMLKLGATQRSTTVYVDSRKNIWIRCANYGCYLYKPSTNQLVAYPQNGKDAIIPEGNISDITEDGENVIFVFDDGKLAKLNYSTNSIVEVVDYVPKHSLDVNTKFKLFVDSEGDYWMNSNGQDGTGIWLFEKKHKKWSHLTSSANSLIPISDLVSSVAQDKKGRIWLACDHGGVIVVNKSTYSSVKLLHDAYDSRSIMHNSVNSVYCDPNGLVWIGYFKKGASYYGESIYKFSLDNLGSFGVNCSMMPDVNAIEEDIYGNIWVGTNGNGLLRIDGKTGAKTTFIHSDNNSNSLSNNVIVDIFSASDGRLWIGTFLGGIDVFDGQKFTNLRNTAKHGSALASTHIWSIKEDAEHNIWVGTLGDGLVKIDSKTGSTEEFNEENGMLPSNYISSLIVCKDGRLAIGTAAGAAIIDVPNRSSKFLNSEEWAYIHIANGNVNQVFEDSRGLLWIATQNGLSIVDFKAAKSQTLNMSDGMSSNIICGIVEDDNKNLWITTSNGVTNIIVSTDPRTSCYTYSLYNYDELDGLQGHEFNKRSVLHNSYGEIFFGGTYGINRFRPEDIKYNKTLPTVKFTGLKLFNKPVAIDSVYNGHRILKQSLISAKEFSLKYNQNVFSISFSTLSYILPEKVRYQYKLEGFNVDWLTTSKPEITYTNLAPGSYVLKVVAINNDGFRSNEVSELKIVILPPFWRSRWAIIFYLLMIGVIIWYIRRQIQNKELQKYRLKQIDAEAQRKHEMDDMRLRFFTNISHELRTPISLIMSPLETLISNVSDAQNKSKLEMAYRNAVKLLNIVNQLLDFRKSDVNTLKLQLSSGDIVAFIRNAGESFSTLSEKKNVAFGFSTDVDQLYLEFDEDKMGKILLNLLSNAFKFTDAGGRVDIHVGRLTTTDSDQILVSVSDTGIGISDADKKRVFERFFQASHASGAYGGSGIGLYLVNEFVTLHGGRISVTDNVKAGHGSIFTYTLPIHSSEKTFEQKPDFELPELLPTTENDCRKLILVVDDNDDFRAFLRESLEPEFRIDEAANGKVAWKKLETIAPDIIISDVMMPEMDGNELCRLAKNDIRTSHIPFVILTAKTAEEHKIEGLSVGADDYITKPFNFDILNLRIHKLIEMSDIRKEKFNRQIDPEPSEITITTLDEKLIQKAIKYVEDNISRSELSVEEMSKSLGMSRVHLYKKLISITGKSPIEFIRVIRLKRAAQLLSDESQNVSEIAYQVGFNNPKYFSKYFKEEFGMTPSAYQNKISDKN